MRLFLRNIEQLTKVFKRVFL